MRRRGLKVGGLCREGIPRFARECSGPAPPARRARQTRDPRALDLHKGLVEARAEGERPADIQTAE